MTTEETSSAWLLPLIFGAFFIIFPLFWCAIVWLTSQLSGWGWLAQRYRAQQPASGKQWSWQYGMVGWLGYNGILTLTAATDGLFVETMWLFRFGHPRLFIPWSDFHEAKIIHYFFRRQVRAKIGTPPKTTVRLPAAVFEQSEGLKLLQESPIGTNVPTL